MDLGLPAHRRAAGRPCPARAAPGGSTSSSCRSSSMATGTPRVRRRSSQQHGLRPTVCVAMGPGRELCATDAGDRRLDAGLPEGASTRRRSVGAGAIAGPIYASVGRTWRMSPEERRQCYAELRDGLRPVAEYGAERGVKVAVEPLVRYETSVINTVEQALEAIDGLPPEGCGLLVDTYHANVEEKDFGGRVHAGGRPARARARLGQRPRRPGRRPHRLARLPRRAARAPATRARSSSSRSPPRTRRSPRRRPSGGRSPQARTRSRSTASHSCANCWPSRQSRALTPGRRVGQSRHDDDGTKVAIAGGIRHVP